MNKESSTLKSSTILKERNSKNLKTYNGGLGANPIKQHSILINSLKKNCEKRDYTSPMGIEKLNNRLKQLYCANNVLVGNGLKEMIFILLLGFNEDIILTVPCWVSYIEQTKILNRTTYFIRTDIKNNFKLTPELLEETILKSNIKRKKLLFLNNQTNQTGAVYTINELIKI